jgi:hypothetical protein
LPNSIEAGIDVYQSFIQSRQNIQYYDIKDMDVLIEDTSAMSSRYFKIVKMPNQFEGGKNAIFLLGDSEYLEKDTEILIEVLDANGDNIFVETTEYGPDRLWDQTYQQTIADAKGGKRCIAIWVQEDAAPGIGQILIAGIASRTPSGELIARSLKPNINKYADKYNVRWSQDIVIEPFRPNSSELIYLDYDRRKYTTLSSSNALSASMYEATWSYSYITSDNNTTLNTNIYYSMSSPYRDFHSALELDGVSANPIAGERIPGWMEFVDTNTAKNVIRIGVKTGSGRQVGYVDPQPTFVWGPQTDSATKNISQSLPTPVSTYNFNGAGINVQVDDVNGLTNQGIISAYGFAIDGKDMWKLMASHSFWAPNTSNSIGNTIYSHLYPNGPYHVQGDAQTLTDYYFYPASPSSNTIDGNVSFGPVGNFPISASNQLNHGWADYSRPLSFANIDTVVNEGWHASASIFGIGQNGNNGMHQTNGMMGFNETGGAYYNFGLIHHYFGEKMGARTNAPIWTRFSRSADTVAATRAVYSHSANPPPSGQTGQTPQTAYKQALSVQRSLSPSNISLDYIDATFNQGPNVYKNFGVSSYCFYNATQKIYQGIFAYNADGTNTPPSIGGINDFTGDGGLNQPAGQFNVLGQERVQKFMLWYKPQFDYQTIPFRGYIEPEPSLHNRHSVTICPHPWSFTFTRSAIVYSEEFADYYTNAHENGNAVFETGGMPYFDGEMGWNGMAQGLELEDLSGGMGFLGDPYDPPYPPPPPPAGQSAPKVILPNYLTFLYYDTPSTDSTFANNFFVGSANGCLPGVDTGNPATFESPHSEVVNGIDYQFDYISFFNEWINSGVHVSMSYAQQPQQYEVNNIVSYLNFRVKNFQPITGDVYKIKVYKRPKSGLKSWEFLDDVVVERTELLISESTSRPISPIGFFDQQETIDNNWYTGSGTYLTHNFPDTDAGGNPIPVSTSIAEYSIMWDAYNSGYSYPNESNPNAYYPPFPTASISDSVVLGSIVLGSGQDLVSQSWDYVTAALLPAEGNGLLYYPDGYQNFSPPLNNPLGNLRPGKARSFYDFYHKDGITLSTGQTYELSFIAHAKQYAAFSTGSDGAPTGHNPPCMHVYMSGSSFPDQHPQDPLYEHNFGRYVRTYFIHPDQAADGQLKGFGKQYAFFQTNEMASNNRLRFIVTGGQWMLSELSIRNVSQTGFTPPDFGFQVKLGTEQFGEFMDFKLEMYNWYGQKANKDIYLPNYFIQGGNTWTNNANDVNAGSTQYQNPNTTIMDGGITIFGQDPQFNDSLYNPKNLGG